MKCRICNQEINLVPSATERAKKYGGKAADYTALFTTHAECALDERRRQTLDLIARKDEDEKKHPIHPHHAH